MFSLIGIRRGDSTAVSILTDHRPSMQCTQTPTINYGTQAPFDTLSLLDQPTVNTKIRNVPENKMIHVQVILLYNK